MNKNFNIRIIITIIRITVITLRQGYTGIISLETFQVNIFQIYATQPMGYWLMEKTFLMYLTLTNFTQRKRKTEEVND